MTVLFTESKEVDAASLTDRYLTHLFELGKQLVSFSVSEHFLPKLKENHLESIRSLLFSGHIFAAFNPKTGSISGIKRSELIRMSETNKLCGFPDPLDYLLVFRVRNKKTASLPGSLVKESQQTPEFIEKLSLPRRERPLSQVNIYNIIPKVKKQAASNSEVQLKPLYNTDQKNPIILRLNSASNSYDKKRPMLIPLY